jgi:hypothetical protein
MRFILLSILLAGCAKSQCELSIENLQPVNKIPKEAKINISDKILADDGGHIMLKNYVIMSNQIDSIIDNCKSKR